MPAVLDDRDEQEIYSAHVCEQLLLADLIYYCTEDDCLKLVTGVTWEDIFDAVDEIDGAP